MVGRGRRKEEGNEDLSLPASDAFCIYPFFRRGGRVSCTSASVRFCFSKKSFQEVSGVLVSVPLAGALLGLLPALP